MIAGARVVAMPRFLSGSTMPRFRFDFTVPALDVIKRSGACPKIAADASAYDAAKAIAQLWDRRQNALIVTGADGSAEGILTARDFFTKLPLAQGAARATTVREIMRPAAEITLGRHTCTMEQVVASMRRLKTRSFPLVAPDGTVRVVVNMRDIAEQLFLGLQKTPPRGLTARVAARRPRTHTNTQPPLLLFLASRALRTAPLSLSLARARG